MVIFIFFSFNVLADIEDEIYEPDIFEENRIKKKELVYEKNIKFKKMMTCVFKKTDYKRIFRFGITTDNNFFYREPLTFNKEIVGFTKEKLFLTKKNNTYVLKISRGNEELDLEINFNEKKSNLSKNFILVSRVNCK
tara:strand:- start:67 stop:477 length:411 start_codon:yes stop_codon:yes gene_type:complete